MVYSKKNIDPAFINLITMTNLRYFKNLSDKVLKYDSDSEHEHRTSVSLCKYCFYITPDRIGGAVMTTQPCGICEEDQRYGSTATNVICKKCGIKYELCVHCGADLLDRPKRKFVK
jgi:hypothetical protein